MAAPQVAESETDDETPDSGMDEAEAVAESSTPEPEDDPNVAQVELTDDDLDGGSDLFTGEDDVGGESGAVSDVEEPEDADSDDDGDDDGEDVLDALDARGENMEDAINGGAARLAVVGVKDQDEKEDLETEFSEVFSAFRLGYFGSRFVEEYIFTDEEEEVDPTWGMLGAMLVSMAFVVWMRPDGDEIVEQAQDAVENIIGGDLP